METLRAFIAVEMPGTVGEVVRSSQDSLRRDGIHLRWVRPANVHLTLRFLGDISASSIPAIREAMEKSACRSKPFFLRLSGMGVFPGLKHPKVIWLGIQGQVDLLEELYRNLSASLVEQGIPPEKRSFKGHLTIGRVKGWLDSKNLEAALLRSVTIKTDDFLADTICLYKSDLTPGGAVYTPLVQTTIKS